MIQDYSQKLKIKKQKQNIIIIISIKKQYKKECKSYSRIFSVYEKIKKRNYSNNKNKNMSDKDRERKKEYMKN